jgi:hypothetical protein
MITKTFNSLIVNTDTPLIYDLHESVTSDPNWRWVFKNTITDVEV